jgi:hypothetical protein
MRIGLGGGGRVLRGGASVGRGGVRGGVGVGPFSVSGGSGGGGLVDVLAGFVVLIPIILKILFYVTLFVLTLVGVIIFSVVSVPILTLTTIRQSSKLSETRWVGLVLENRSAVLLSGLVSSAILYFYGFVGVSMARNELVECESANTFSCVGLTDDLRMWESLQPILITLGVFLVSQIVLILGVSRARGQKIDDSDIESIKNSVQELKEKIFNTKQRAINLRQQAKQWVEELDSDDDDSLPSKAKND